MIKNLGLNIDDAMYGSVDRVYEKIYGIERQNINNNIPMLTFKNSYNELKKFLTKNEDGLKKIWELQSKKINN